MSKLKKSYLSLLTCTLMSLGIGAPSTLNAEGKRFVSRAFDLKTGKLLYLERHKEIWQNGQHSASEISYVKPSGKVFAFKKVNYQKGKTDPDFQMLDYRDGYMESSTRVGRQYRTKVRARKGAAVESALISPKANMVVDAGFDYFIRQNFDTLAAGQTRQLNFVAPARKGAFAFRIFKTGTATVKGRSLVKLRLQLANSVLRLLADNIDVWYYTDTRQLYLYQGISNINDGNGKSHKVRIIFSY